MTNLEEFLKPVKNPKRKHFSAERAERAEMQRRRHGQAEQILQFQNLVATHELACRLLPGTVMSKTGKIGS